MSQTELGETADKPTASSEPEPGSGSVNPRAVCGVCRRLYREPKILPCLHTFCSDCVGELERFSAPPRGRVTAAEAAEPRRDSLSFTVLCPECDTEVDIPQSGPAGLSTDHLALDEVFLEALVSGGPLGCDLCGEGSAESRCEACSLNLCEFCRQAHRWRRPYFLH